MSDHVKITEMKCPGCGSALRMPPGGARFVRCEYCGGEYAVDWNQGYMAPRQAPNWRPVVPPPGPKQEESPGKYVAIGIICFLVCSLGAFFLLNTRSRKESVEVDEQIVVPEIGEEYEDTYTKRKDEQMAENVELTGMLGEMVKSAFGKDAENVSTQELSQIKWIADDYDFDYSYIGYSFEDPIENPDAELIWLSFSDDLDLKRGYEGLCAFKGLKKLDSNQNLHQCDLKGLKLESLSASFETLEEAAAAVDDPGLIRELGIKRSVDSLEGLELFPNVEKLSVDAGSLSDVDAVIRMRHLKSLTLEDADLLSDFSIFGAAAGLEELIIESENLRSLDFLKKMPQLKSFGISDGTLLSLDGLEALANLEELSVTDCDDLKEMSAVEGMTGLKVLTIENGYECEEPSLGALTKLTELTLKNFHSCGFIQNMTELTQLKLEGCDMPENIDLSGLTQLKKLTCTTSYTDRSLKFIGSISSLESINLRGMVTYEDISGIFALPAVREIDISGIECEIDFDKVGENTSLETLKMSGVMLYENVSVSGGGGIVYVDWDEVFLADHLDFFRSFPNLKKLDIAENEITDLGFAESLVKLEEIDFSDNYVTEMRPLAASSALKLVNCAGNPIGNLQVLGEDVVIIAG